MKLAILLHPLPASPGRYVAMLDGMELCRSRQPLNDAARILLRDELSPDVTLEARHVGSDIVAQRSTLGEAAKWTVTESDRGGLSRRRWQPFAGFEKKAAE